ncbi:hypothetical protein cypCar_00048372 [Cyprinus carpio]|nr:hypothetical protein cypCar_00048372 [Cyprinus carpio]
MTILLFIIFIWGSISSHVRVESRSQSEVRVSGRALYKLDISWPKNPEYFSGQVFGVAVNHLAGLVYVAQKCASVRSYGHTVKQYSPSGKLLQVLGSPGRAGSSLSPLQFDQPAEIFVHSSGEIYIVDGDGGLNNRLIKLSRDLQVLWMHGEKGQGLAQFYIPHSVAVDSYQRVCVRPRPHFCF